MYYEKVKKKKKIGCVVFVCLNLNGVICLSSGGACDWSNRVTWPGVQEPISNRYGHSCRLLLIDSCQREAGGNRGKGGAWRHRPIKEENGAKGDRRILWRDSSRMFLIWSSFFEMLTRLLRTRIRGFVNIVKVDVMTSCKRRSVNWIPTDQLSRHPWWCFITKEEMQRVAQVKHKWIKGERKRGGRG